jgi:hypothetical protein
MIRSVPFVLQGILMILWAGPSFADQAKGGTQPPTQGGGQPPTQGGAQPPTQGGTQPPTQGGGQPPTQGQVGQGKAGIAQTGVYYGNMSQTPFFANPGVQKQLNLNDAQMNQLQQHYGTYFNQYQKDLSAGQANRAKGDTSQPDSIPALSPAALAADGLQCFQRWYDC